VADPLDGLANLPLGVVVVAAGTAGRRSCSTGTAAYGSADPPLVVTPLAAPGRTGELVRASGEFSLSVLAAEQAELAVRAAASSSGDKFAEQQIETIPPPAGRNAPGIQGALSVLWCDLELMVELGHHVLCVGRVREVAEPVPAAVPLLRFRRIYHSLGEELPVAAQAAYPL
jgi:flavin reductase (DIM6/NTAB) family NADH-FMN oxidoreductase RutF